MRETSAEYDVSPLKAAVVGGMLRSISEERITLVNASFIAQSRGIRIIEERRPGSENYTNLVTVGGTHQQRRHQRLWHAHAG